MDEPRKNLLVRVIKIVIIVSILFAIITMLQEDVSKTGPKFIADLWASLT